MENGRERQRTVRGRRKRAREMQMERRVEYCRACCAMQAEAEGNENGNLHAGVEGQRGVSTVDARSTTSPAEAGLKS